MSQSIEKSMEIDNIPNRLTMLRLILVPFVVILLYFASPSSYEWAALSGKTLGWIAGWLFVIASITDFFDGYIARKMNINTLFGSFLDPIADKFLVISSLIMLQFLGRIHPFIVVILTCRELYITSLRLLAQSQGVEVPVDSFGKWKTAFQMIGIPMLMAYEKWWIFDYPLLGIICLYIASFLSIMSAIRYSFKMIKQLREKRKKRKGVESE